jgi:hypothetical protein
MTSLSHLLGDTTSETRPLITFFFICFFLLLPACAPQPEVTAVPTAAPNPTTVPASAWTPTPILTETVTPYPTVNLSGGGQIKLGMSNENEGGFVKEFVPPSGFSREQQEKWLEQFDARRVGFTPDATIWIYKNSKAFLVDTNDQTNVLAEWNELSENQSLKTGDNGVVWDWDKEQVRTAILKVCETAPKGSMTADGLTKLGRDYIKYIVE